MYWDKKVEIWGPARAFHRLSILDFEETDRIALERGGVRVLPARDKGGRAIIVIDKTRFDQRITHRRSMVRASIRLESLDTTVSANSPLPTRPALHHSTVSFGTCTR